MILNYSRSGGRSRRWCRTSRGRRCRSCWLERVAVEVAEVVVGVTGVSCFRYTLQWYTDFRFQYSQIPWKKVILRWFLVISSDFKWFQVILPGNLDITLLTPPVTPGVLDQPVILSTLSAVTDNGDGMISLGVAATRSSVITNNHQKSLILTNSCWTRPSCSSWSYTSWSRWQWRRSRTCRRGPSSSPRCTCSPWRPWSLWLLSSRSWFQRGSTAYGQVIKVIKSDQKWSKVIKVIIPWIVNPVRVVLFMPVLSSRLVRHPGLICPQVGSIASICSITIVSTVHKLTKESDQLIIKNHQF